MSNCKCVLLEVKTSLINLFGFFCLFLFWFFFTVLQVGKKDSSTYSYQDVNLVENKQASFQLPNRTTRLINPARGSRRLSLVQELNQTIDLDTAASLYIKSNEVNGEKSETPHAKGNTRKRSERISSDVISETEEIDRLPNTEDLGVNTYPDIKGSEIRDEAKLSVFEQNKNTIELEVSQLRAELSEDIKEMNRKLSRLESQLSRILHFVQNPTRAELKPRHTQSFPSPTLASRNSRRETRNDHPGSMTNFVTTQEDAGSSPNWLTLKSSVSNLTGSAESRRTTSVSLHDKDIDIGSPPLIARHGRRKIDTSET